MTKTEYQLAPELTVNDMIRHYPSTVAVFQSVGIDTCCGGALPILTAAERHGVDMAVLGALLEKATINDRGANVR